MGKFSNWSKEEDEILLEMIQTTRSKKWIKTSLRLQEKGCERSPSECRQRYINYLAPDIDKGEITQKELRLIYNLYEEFGPKWSLIQQSVKRKTQCKIKNVFYGNVKNLLKTTYKFFTFKTAPFINTISTDYLQLIYDGSLEFDGMTQSKEGIRAMSYRNNKFALIRYILNHKKRFLDLINTVLHEVFNRAPLKCVLNEEHERKIARLLRSEPKSQSTDGLSEESQPEESSQEEEDEMSTEEKKSPDHVKVETEAPQVKCEEVQKKEEEENYVFPFSNYPADHMGLLFESEPVPYPHYYPLPCYYYAPPI